jgi:hypothetical protein
VCPVCGGELQATDDDGVYRCHRNACSGGRTLFESDHVITQYQQLTHDWRVGPIVAFERGVELDDDNRLEGDEFRYDHPSRTVLIREGTSLTTAIDATSARLNLKRAVTRTCVLELQSPQATGEFCADAGIDTATFRRMTEDLRDNNAGARSGRSSGHTATRNSYSDQGASD